MSLASDLQYDNFVWDAIADNLPASRRRGTGKFDININCPMCVLRGERRPDTKFRLGLKRNPSGLGANCFNCGFKTRWHVGEYISEPLANFLLELGVGDTEVKRLNHRALVIARTLGSDMGGLTPQREFFEPEFPIMELPKGARTLAEWLDQGCDDPRFTEVLNYLASRGTTIATSHTYYWTPDAGEMMAQRVIIPLLFKDQIVGWTGRAINTSLDIKYHSDIPSDILFNARALNIQHREFILLLEGPFDAIAIDGVGTMGAKLSDNQTRWINSANKTPILVIDRDSSGQRNVAVALRNKWHAAFPRLASAGWWDADVKDTAEAVKRYGRLYTLQSILKTATNDPRKIEVWSKLLI